MTKKIFMPLLFVLIACGNLFANVQTADTLRKYAPFDIDYATMNLPPLSVFLDAANNYADVKYYEERENEARLEMEIAKRDWLKYLRVQGNYQYGTTNAYILQSGDQYPINNAYSSTNTQNWYNIGVVLSVPFDDLFSRKKKTDVMKSRASQINYEAEKTLENRRLVILQTYNEVIKHLAILKVKAEAMALYNAQMMISEADFVNGQIDIISLSLERGRRAAASVSYEESRAALHNAVTLLEMLTKVKIIQRN